MPRSSCAPCCNPSEMARMIDTYRASVLQILCSMADTANVQLLCVPVSFAPVFVQYGLDENGDVEVLRAFTPDGSDYGGSVAALIACR